MRCGRRHRLRLAPPPTGGQAYNLPCHVRPRRRCQRRTESQGRYDQYVGALLFDSPSFLNTISCVSEAKQHRQPILPTLVNGKHHTRCVTASIQMQTWSVDPSIKGGLNKLADVDQKRTSSHSTMIWVRTSSPFRFATVPKKEATPMLLQLERFSASLRRAARIL